MNNADRYFLLPSRAMRRSRFSYVLPEKLIAQQPVEPRDSARMLRLDRSTGELQDGQIAELPALLRPGDIVVLNDTRVIPARLFGRKDSGGRVEVLVERVLDHSRALAQVRASKPPRPGSRILIDGGGAFEVLDREAGFFLLLAEPDRTVMQILEASGHMPLPPYIHRDDVPADRERYQTVFARHDGAVAAPTAGLHFSEQVLDDIRARGAELASLTLHVGAGTFQPVRTEEIEAHHMHSERIDVSDELCAAIRRAKADGGRVVAVGTTVVRALETAAASGTLQPVRGETDVFIRPGFEFRVVDALLTNFHLSESTLLMLVAAFAGIEEVMRAYEHAVANRYRFYSYGDAMFIS